MNSKSSNRRGDESPAFDGSNTMRELRGKMERALSICTTNTTNNNNNNNAYISPTKLSSIGQQDGGGGGPRTGTATGTSRNIYTSTPTYKQHDTNNYNNNNNNSYILPNKIPISPVAMAATPTNRSTNNGAGGGGAGSGFMSPTFSKENPYGRSKNSPFLKPPHSPSPNKSTTHTSLSPTSPPQVLVDLAVASNLMPSPIPPHTDYAEPVSRAPSSSLSSSIHAIAEAKYTPSTLPTTTTSSSTTATSPRTRGPDSKLTSNDQADAKYTSTRYESKATHHSEPSYAILYSESKLGLNDRNNGREHNSDNDSNTLDTLKRKSQRMKDRIDQEYEREQSHIREQEYKHTSQHISQHATQQSQQGQGQANHYISESHSSGDISVGNKGYSSAGQTGHVGHSSSSNSIPPTAAEDKATYSYSSSFSTSPQVRHYLYLFMLPKTYLTNSTSYLYLFLCLF